MPHLTEAERRGARWLALLLVVGSVADLTHAWFPGWTRPMEAAPVASPQVPAPDTAPAPEVGAAAAQPRTVIDLNRATVQELDRLPGIGPVLARRIVEHRERQGRFRSVEELLAVPGIGPRLLERLRTHVTAAGPAPP